MQGVGTTSLAAAYARAQVAARWRLVAWVNAEDPGGVLAGVAAVADGLGPDVRREDAAAAALALRRWLEAGGDRCLLVFDNATDPRVLQPFIPATGRARVIITGTDRSVAGLGTDVPVGVFSVAEALAFLAKLTGLDDADGAGELAAELGNLPLALAQAAAVIAAQHLDYAGYLDRLRATPVKLPGPGGYPRGVAAAVLLSLDDVRDGDDGVVCTAVMELLAVLSAAGVSRFLLHEAARQGALDRDGQAGAPSPEALNRALARALDRLARASLLTFSRDGSTVSAHRMVTRVIREQLSARNSLEAVCLAAARLLDRLAESYSQTWQENRSAARDLVEQIMALFESSPPQWGPSELELQMIRLRVQTAWLLTMLGDIGAQPDLDQTRRSRVGRAHLRLTRTYSAQFSTEGLLDLGESQIRDLRLNVVEHAVAQLRTAHVTTSCDITLGGDLTIEISAADHVPAPDYVTATILREIVRYSDRACQSLPEKIRECTDRFRKADRAGRANRPWLDQSYERFGREALFKMTSFRTVLSTVDFSVDSRVAAAVRNRRRLESYAERSVLGYYEGLSRSRPEPDKYAISRGGRSALRITSAEAGTAEEVAAALLGESRGSRPARRSIDGWPPASTPYWGLSTLASAVFAVVIAAFAVTPAWLAITALGTAAAVGSALVLARRAGASVLKTLLGMSPSAIVLGFAVYYGSLMLGRHPQVVVAATAVPHLVDAFLLSLGMATTGGFFDLALRATAVRVAAFAEMLLMVSVVGGSLYAGARAAWDRLSEALRIGAEGQPGPQ